MAWSVERLVETGRFEAHEWAAANPVLPVYWGWLFSTLFGFSFAVLRVSTLVLAWSLGGPSISSRSTTGFDNDEAGVLALSRAPAQNEAADSMRRRTDAARRAGAASRGQGHQRHALGRMA